jgi:hypothetical protein
MQNRNARNGTNGIRKKKREINNVRVLCLAGTAIALVVEVDRDRFGIVCIEVTALFLGQGVAGDHWHMLVLNRYQDGLDDARLQRPARH